MPGTERPYHSRQRQIYAILRARCLFRSRLYRRPQLFHQRLERSFELVEFLPDGFLQIPRRRLQPIVGDFRNDAGLPPQPLIPKFFELLFIRNAAQVRFRLCANSIEQRSHLLRAPHALFR